jgi:hypothetical protein
MPLFVVQHRHAPEACPASATNGRLLLSHVSASNAARYGVAIQAEAVLDGQHGLILIVRAPDRSRVEEFTAFFAHLGEVLILSASCADEAVARGGCDVAATPPATVEQHGMHTT